MTPIFAIIALVVLVPVYLLRGLKFAIGALLVLGIAYMVAVQLITRSMPNSP